MQLCNPQLLSVPAQLHSCTELWEPWFREVPRLPVIREGEDSGREGLSTCDLEDLCGGFAAQHKGLTLALCSWTTCTLASSTLSMKIDPQRDPSECVLHICVLWHMHKIVRSFDIFENHSLRALLISHEALMWLKLWNSFPGVVYFKKNRRVACVILINGPTQYLIRLNSLNFSF